MKKSIFLLTTIVALTSCNTTNNLSLNIIAPEGTPSLGLSNFYIENVDSYEKFDIKGGSDALVAAFNQDTYDIIVAPTNLGVKFYNLNKKYVLYQTIVWGNLYLASKSEISSFTSLENKKITYFGGQSATPYIILKSLINHHNLKNVTLENVDDVVTANSMLMSNKSDIIVSAQPSLSKVIKNASANNVEIHTLDLQKAWEEMTNKASYPQASIFFKKSLKHKIDDVLKSLTASVNKAIEDPSTTAKNAVNMYDSFKNLGEDILTTAIPQSHFGFDENQKEAIEFYLNKMSELNLGNLYGDELPDEGFYYSI